MLSAVHHQCPNCHGFVDVENFVQARVVNPSTHEVRTDEFLYCEFCERGYERSVYADGSVYPLEYIHKTEPVNFGKFLQRMEDARAA